MANFDSDFWKERRKTDFKVNFYSNCSVSAMNVYQCL